MSTHPDHDPTSQPAGPDAAGTAAPTTPDEALATAQAQLQEARDAQLRALAEMENVRRRAQRDVESAHRFAVERFAADMVEVRDTLELGIAAAGSAPEAVKFVEGSQATLRVLDKAFEKAGIAVLDPTGQNFNPEFHEAMVAQPTADHPAGSVLAVIQKGFTLSGRLLRPARVVIARAPDPAN
jgi:molecular chaperone GrpE